MNMGEGTLSHLFNPRIIRGSVGERSGRGRRPAVIGPSDAADTPLTGTPGPGSMTDEADGQPDGEPDVDGADPSPTPREPEPAEPAVERADDPTTPMAPDVPEDVRKYDRFKKMDGATYDRANDFLRDRTYITAREWAIARLCADFRTETGVEMTKIGENLPHLVPFMTDTYTPQAVNQARASFKEKVRKSGATFRTLSLNEARAWLTACGV